MKIHPFCASFPNLPIIASTDSFFTTVKDKYTEYKNSGFYLQDKDPSLFVYQIISDTGNYSGIVAANDILDVDHGAIVHHEKTMASKEQLMMELMLERKAQIKPVLLGYYQHDLINSFIAEVTNRDPFMEMSYHEKNEQHIIWKVHDKAEIIRLQQLFEKYVKKAYIADGHHRCTTAMMLRKNKLKHSGEKILDSLLTLFIPFSQLKIYDYNRVIDLSDRCSSLAFMASLSKYLKIIKVNEFSKPKNKFELSMVAGDEFFQLKWKKRIVKKYSGYKVVLDSFLFNKYILKKLLSVKNIRNTSIVQYIPGPHGPETVAKVVRKMTNSIGFCLPPVQVDELTYIADMGQSLPPKSTWFEPRTINGLLCIPFYKLQQE